MQACDSAKEESREAGWQEAELGCLLRRRYRAVGEAKNVGKLMTAPNLAVDLVQPQCSLQQKDSISRILTQARAW
jgi:hypothetical protein